jgi:hypothetical protein
MSAWAIGLIALVCAYAGALLGLELQRRLPEHHLSNESKDAVKVVAGLLATLSALVLGLLIASAKGSFDAVSNALKQSAAKVIVIDRLLGEYGPEAKAAREELKHQYAERAVRLFPEGRGDHGLAKLAPEASAAKAFQRSLRTLVPDAGAPRCGRRPASSRLRTGASGRSADARSLRSRLLIEPGAARDDLRSQPDTVRG